MEKLLEQLLAKEVLTEETKQELQAALKEKLDEAIRDARIEAQATVTAELNEAWIKERDVLIEALDARVSEALASELKEFADDVERFRDVEAEYAEKLVEAKQEMAATLKSDMAQLITKLDEYLTLRVTTEMDELREDLDEVRKLEFGRRVFESFVTEFKKHYAGDDTAEVKLSETEQRLEATTVALREAQQHVARLERATKMEKVLAPLTGRSREVMEAILKTTDTSKLEETYSMFVGRILKETSSADVTATSEKEEKVLAEGQEAPRGVVKTGNNEVTQLTQVLESEAPKQSSFDRKRLQMLGGVRKV